MPDNIIRETLFENYKRVKCNSSIRATGSVRGFYQYFQRNNIIYIDESLPTHEQIFVCAHELGHMFLHKKSNTIFMDTYTNFNTSKYENEANKFAMELLIPDNFLIENQNYTVGQIARRLGYNEELIKLRLK